MHSLRSTVSPSTERRWELPPPEIIRRGLQTNDLPAWSRARPWRRIPLIPMPLGFIVNTLCLAPVALLLVEAGGRARRRLRRRIIPHPACSSCGYNLTGLDDGASCPECGTANAAGARRQHAD
jgi:hypothetical protein